MKLDRAVEGQFIKIDLVLLLKVIREVHKTHGPISRAFIHQLRRPVKYRRLQMYIRNSKDFHNKMIIALLAMDNLDFTLRVIL